MDDNFIQEEFEQVAEMTLKQKEERMSVVKGSIVDELQCFGMDDLEVLEGVLATIQSLKWLRDEHQKEGWSKLIYSKKKNKHGANEANIQVFSSYSLQVTEKQSTIQKRTFLDNTFNIDTPKE